MTMPHGFENTWGIVKDSGLVLSTCLLFSLFICLKFLMSSIFPYFQLAFFHAYQTNKKPSSVGFWRCLLTNEGVGT